MTIVTPEGLKKMAAESAVALKQGIPLNDSITKIAMDNEMNSDQVKRLVETTNQVVYLSQLEDQDDRTFEFPVANYDDIMNGLITGAEHTKTASHNGNPMDIINGVFNPIEKVAQEKEATIEKWGKNQKLQALKKVASQERNRLDELKSAEYDTLVKLAQHRAIICRDPEALEKMAQFDNGREMAKLVFGHTKVAEDTRRVWSPDQLAHIQNLSERLTMVKQASEEIKELEPKVLAAEEIIKQAAIGTIARLAMAAKPDAAKIKAVKGFAKNTSTNIGNKLAKPTAKAKKGFTTADTAITSNEIRRDANKNYNAWSSLRG